MNKQAKVLATAKSTTVKKICKGLFQKLTVHTEDSDLMRSTSPLQIQAYQTIKALMGLKAAARKCLTPKSELPFCGFYSSKHVTPVQGTPKFSPKVPAVLVPKEKCNNKKCPGGDCPNGDWELGGGDKKHTRFCLTIQTIMSTQRSRPASSTASPSKYQTLH
eukprot:1589781-Ditylum_brightwellii.AAC.1